MLCVDEYNDMEVLEQENNLYCVEDKIFILCTCVFYIIDYNPNLILD